MTMARQTPGEPAELEALLALAQREHRAGRLAEAAAACRKILAIRPDIAEMHNNLGSVLVSQGQLDEAVAQFERAVALKPDLFQAHYNLANVLRDQGKFEQAVARYQQAIALKPDLVDAHNNLGIIFAQHGLLEQAVAWFEQSLALRPDSAEAHYNLANLLLSQGKLAAAAARYEQALARRPDYAEAHNNLGTVLLSQGRLDEAAARHQQALNLRPDYAEAHYNLGTVLLRQRKLDEAAASFQQALALRPDNAEAHNNLGTVLLNQDKLDEAAARYEQALALRPSYAEAHYNLGTVLLNHGKLDQAAARFEQALALKPDYAEAHHNLAIGLWHQDKRDLALTRFKQAIALRPDYADPHWGLAACYLVEGDYERGWPAYEGRLRQPGLVPQVSLPRWTGQPLAGRSLLLLAEQGFGDTIQFIRYARLLKERGARVVLAAPKALGRLLASERDVDELFILGSAEELPRCDFYLPLLSAPGALGTDATTIPCEIPYLAAEPGLTEQWRRELAGIEGFKIGIAWQGSRSYNVDRWRSVPLVQFAPLARLAGVRLISLQKGLGSEQVAAVDFPVLDLSGRLDEVAGPFMDTAAVIRNLDLVVTVDTAIAHLEGALGAPVWMALPFSPEWRWLRDRDDSPWYPTIRLFRQRAFGQWSDVFDRIANAIQARRSEPA